MSGERRSEESIKADLAKLQELFEKNEIDRVTFEHYKQIVEDGKMRLAWHYEDKECTEAMFHRLTKMPLEERIKSDVAALQRVYDRDQLDWNTYQANMVAIRIGHARVSFYRGDYVECTEEEYDLWKKTSQVKSNEKTQ